MAHLRHTEYIGMRAVLKTVHPPNLRGTPKSLLVEHHTIFQHNTKTRYVLLFAIEKKQVHL
jgi:hypothetical protein